MPIPSNASVEMLDPPKPCVLSLHCRRKLAPVRNQSSKPPPNLQRISIEGEAGAASKRIWPLPDRAQLANLSVIRAKLASCARFGAEGRLR